MKIKPVTQKQAQAISNLRNNADFVVFLGYVGDYGENIVKALLQNPRLENPEYHRGVGGGISEIFESVEKAPTILKQLTNKT